MMVSGVIKKRLQLILAIKPIYRKASQNFAQGF